jgi:hypothetical protein
VSLPPSATRTGQYTAIITGLQIVPPVNCSTEHFKIIVSTATSDSSVQCSVMVCRRERRRKVFEQRGRQSPKKIGVGFSYPLSALHVVEQNRAESKTSATGLRRDTKDSTEALSDSVDTAIFTRTAIVHDRVACAAAAVRERVTVLCCVVPRLSANISC